MCLFHSTNAKPKKRQLGFFINLWCIYCSTAFHNFALLKAAQCVPSPARWGLSWGVFWSDQWSRNIFFFFFAVTEKPFFGCQLSKSDITAVLQCFLFSDRSISCCHCNVVALKIFLCADVKTLQHTSQRYTQSCSVMKSAGWASFEVVDSATSLE